MPSTYSPIATVTASGSTNSVTFSSISGSYTDLIAVVAGATSTSAQGIKLRFNGDSGSNYSRTAVFGTGSSAGSTRDTSVTSIDVFFYGTTEAIGICNVMNYSNTTTFKTSISRGNDAASATNAIASLYRSTSAITSMEFFITSGNFATGSTFTLYGVKSA
jgi:hypothetical protein